VEEIYKGEKTRKRLNKILEFLEKRKARKEDLRAIAIMRNGITKFVDNSELQVLTSIEWPHSDYSPEIFSDAALRTKRDFCSKLNPALNILGRILNSYFLNGRKLSQLTTIYCVNPIVIHPYSAVTLDSLIPFVSYDCTGILDKEEFERLAEGARKRAEYFNVEPTDWHKLDEFAFRIIEGKVVPEKKMKKGEMKKLSERQGITWKKLEEECFKFLMKDFENFWTEFAKKNVKKPILYMPLEGAIHKLCRNVLKDVGVYNPKLDVVSEFLERSTRKQIEEYQKAGLMAPSLLSRFEKILEEKIGARKVSYEPNQTTLEGLKFKEKKLLQGLQLWLPKEIIRLSREGEVQTFFKPSSCPEEGSIFYCYGSDEISCHWPKNEKFCAYERYKNLKRDVNSGYLETDYKYLEERIKEYKIPLYQVPMIVVDISKEIEEDLVPLQLPSKPVESWDYRASYFNQDPVTIALQDLNLIFPTTDELSRMEEGELAHLVSRVCSVSDFDLSSCMEVKGVWKFTSGYGSFKVRCDIDLALLIKDLNKSHVNDRKFHGEYEPPTGQREQVLAYLKFIQQEFGVQPHSSSIHYAFDIKKPRTARAFEYTEEREGKLEKKYLERMAAQIIHYKEIMANPSKAKEYFNLYKDRIINPEAVQEALNQIK
jgi:hypothetical protein